MIVRATVEFSGDVRVEIDMESLDPAIREKYAVLGAKALVQDFFYDNAEFKGHPFVEGSTGIDLNHILLG